VEKRKGIRNVRLNFKKANQIRFEDFLALKTYGQDKVSRMKLEALKDLFLELQLAELTEEVGENKDATDSPLDQTQIES